MKESGDSMTWKEWSKPLAHSRFADKHSTGGVGDKVSLLLAPLAAAMGLKVPMMSGRSLGHTGGTIDKLESIPGFQVNLERSVLLKGLEEFGVAMMGQSERLCPADRKLYALRDVTGTVESIPLITASIVSKKWAEGVDAIVYDVKCGEAAFMKDRNQARALAQSLVTQSKKVGMAASACITPMNEPWGSCVGNALEVQEVLWILDGRFPDPKLQQKSEPLVELTLQLATEMSFLAGLDASRATAYRRAKECLANGKAKDRFQQMCRHQGSEKFVDGKALLPHAPETFTFRSPQKGYVHKVRALVLGELGLELGLGRKQLDSKIHPGNGFVVWVTEGDLVAEGQPLLELHYDGLHQKKLVEQALGSIFEIQPEKTHPMMDVVLERIE
jgi:pyrimidine-nucleoside phosphorylase